MRSTRIKPQNSAGRRGAALVEFSIVLPVLLILLIGSVELGRGISVRGRCALAARAGARVYSLRKTRTEADVRAIVAQIMTESGLKNYTVTLNPTPSPSIKQLDPVKVTVSVSAKDASWMSAPWFLGGETKISSTCAMPADLGEASNDTVATPPIVDTPTLVDDDATGETSGVSTKDLQDLEKDAQDAVEKARKERENADKKQQDADDAAAKAAKSGKKKDYKEAAKQQEEADDAADKALEKEQIARAALQELTKATSQKNYKYKNDDD